VAAPGARAPPAGPARSAAAMRAVLNGGAPTHWRTRRDAEKRRCCNEFLHDIGTSCSRSRRHCHDAFVCPPGAGRVATRPRSTALADLPSLAASTAESLAASGLGLVALDAVRSSLMGGHPELVQVACVPLLGALWEPSAQGVADAAPQAPALAPGQVRRLQSGLIVACATQAAVATLQFILGDPMHGLIGCSIATLGMQAASPHGFKFLPSYIVLTFCNGSMQFLLGLEYPAVRHLLSSLSGSAAMKAAGILALLSPSLMFLGVMIAWKLHCSLRAYQATFAAEREGLAQGPDAGDVAAGGEGLPAPGTSSWRPFSGEGYRLSVAASK